MMKTNLLFLIFLFPVISMAQSGKDYPVLKHYDKDHLLNIALPLGGIGTGTVSLGGRGELRDWEIMNKPGKGLLQHQIHGCVGCCSKNYSSDS